MQKHDITITLANANKYQTNKCFNKNKNCYKQI
jgi:hypothetical protein